MPSPAKMNLSPGAGVAGDFLNLSSQFAGGDGATNPFSPLLFVIQRILSYFAVIPAVFGLRSKFGERYLGPDVAVFSTCIVWGITWIVGLGGLFSADYSQYNQEGDIGVDNFLLAGLLGGFYTIMALVRFGAVMKRWYRDDFTVHSYSDGLPWAVWDSLGIRQSVRPYIVRCFLEPGMFFGAALVLGIITGSWLLVIFAFFMALAYFLQQFLYLSLERGQVLDKADAELEARWAMQDMEVVKAGQEPEAKTATSIPAIARPGIDRRTRALFDAMRSSGEHPALPGAQEPQEGA